MNNASPMALALHSPLSTLNSQLSTLNKTSLLTMTAARRRLSVVASGLRGFVIRGVINTTNEGKIMRRLAVFSCGCLLAISQVLVCAQDEPRKVPEYFPKPSAAEQEFEEALKRTTDFSFSSVSLEEVLRTIAQQQQFNLVFDHSALQDEGLDPSSPISIELLGVSMKTGLQLILEQVGLAYYVRDDVVMITSKSAMEERLVTRLYPIADLLTGGVDSPDQIIESLLRGVGESQWMIEVPPTMAADPSVMMGVGMMHGMPMSAYPATMKQFAGGESTSQTHTSPFTTDRSISAVGTRPILVVRQSYAVHEELLNLLRQMRAAQAAMQELESAQ
jgi:hypothetical protein